MVEHTLGKGEVAGSAPAMGSKIRGSTGGLSVELRLAARIENKMELEISIEFLRF